jgi:hypothetical protein
MKRKTARTAGFLGQSCCRRGRGCLCWRVRFGREQGGTLEEPAKILLAGVLVFAIGELKIRGGFVADFQAFEMDNTDVICATFPDLALLKLHGELIHLS